jgi:hypothetical protein
MPIARMEGAIKGQYNSDTDIPVVSLVNVTGIWKFQRNYVLTAAINSTHAFYIIRINSWIVTD